MCKSKEIRLARGPPSSATSVKKGRRIVIAGDGQGQPLAQTVIKGTRRGKDAPSQPRGVGRLV